MQLEVHRRTRELAQRLNEAATGGDSRELQRVKGDIMLASAFPGAPKCVKKLQNTLHKASGSYRSESDAAIATLSILNFE